MSAVPPLRHIGRCENNAGYSTSSYSLCEAKKSLLTGNGSLRINEHQHDNGNEEHDCADDGNAVEVLLDDAGAGLRGIHGTGDHIGNTRALAGMQQNEDDQANAGQEQKNQKDNYQRTHFELSFTRKVVYASK